MIRVTICLILLVATLGCSQKSEPTRKSWPQTCEMCGKEWTVTTVDGSPVPPTIEWCFSDGNFCEAGLVIVTGAMKTRLPEDEQRWIDHCRSCKGCRCAAFRPGEWHKVVNGDKPDAPMRSHTIEQVVPNLTE